MKEIVLLQVGNTSKAVAEKKGDYDRWFQQGLGVEQGYCVVRVRDGESLPELGKYSAIVVTGSSAMVTDREPWSVNTAKYLAAEASKGAYILGICYGHQLLADALGGKVDYNPNGRQIGTVEATLTTEGKTDPLLEGIGDPLVVQTSHSQSVIHPPQGAVRLALSPKDPNHALRYSNTVWGLQFHPEFDGWTTARYIDERADRIAAEGQNPRELLSKVKDSHHGFALLKRFAKLALALGFDRNPRLPPK